MNEKLQYAEMLDLPEKTCSVTFKQPKKSIFAKKKRPSKEVKEELLKMVNEKEIEEEKKETDAAEDVLQDVAVETETIKDNAENAAVDKKKKGILGLFVKKENVDADKTEENDSTVSVKEKRKERKPFKISIIGVELAVIALLIGTIAITGALIPNSGVKVFMESVFGSKEQAAASDKRNYAQFKPTIPVSAENLSVENGIMTLKGTESVYSPCDGVITSLIKAENGKYDMKISHSGNFVTVFTGLDYAYFSMGDSVYSTVPVGRVSGGTATACFESGDGSVITGYTLSGSAVVWAV